MSQTARKLSPLSTEIFGRDPEFLRVTDFLDSVSSALCALVLEGEAGIGKTTVWTWGLQRAAALGYRVLACRPTETESKLSYAALADLMTGVEDQVLEALPEPQRHGLAVAMLRESGHGQTLDPRLVGTAVTEALRKVATSSPTVLAIDDVQWLDAPTRRVLEFAIRRLREDRVAVLVAQRSREDGSAPLGLERALPQGRLSRVQLPPLSLGAMHHMLRAQLGADFSRSVLVRLHQVSAGNPFYALELGRHITALHGQLDGAALPLPGSLRELIARRLAGLPWQTLELLLAAAALSQPSLTVLRRVADRPEQVERDLDQAVGAGVIEVRGDRISFAHPLLAAVIYSTATPSKRRSLHHRVAAAVPNLEERARHLALAATGPNEATAAVLDRAAERARGRGAPEAAAALLEDARRLTPSRRGESSWRRTSAAAMCHYLAGNTERARELWEEIETSAPPGPARARALWHLSEFRHSGLDLAHQVEAAERALSEAGDDVALMSVIHHTLALTWAWNGDVRRARPHAKAALEFAERGTDSSVIAMAESAAFFISYLAGEGWRSELIDRALKLERTTQHLPVENSPRLFRAMVSSWLGEGLDGARRDLADLCRQAQDTGREISLPLLYYLMSDLECRAGDLTLADDYATRSLEAAGRTEQVFRTPLGLLARASAQSRRGDLDAARATVEEGLAVNRTAGVRFTEALFWSLLGFVELSRNDPAAALGWLEQVVRFEGGGYVEPTALRARHDAVEALIEVGRVEAAEALLTAMEGEAAPEQGWWHAMHRRCQGILAGARGDLDSARAYMEEALRAHDGVADPFELGRTLLALGNVQRRSRQKRAARESLQRALAVFGRLGSAGWAARASAEMSRLGIHTSAPDELSATEERVARLVAAGHTNREIAAALFVSVKAVEGHLTHIYTKLGLRSRTELALRQHGATL